MSRCLILLIVFVLAWNSFSLAQPPSGDRRGTAGGGGRGDDAFAQKLVTLDEDDDGALSIKELPEHMQPYFATSDRDHDGRLRGDEIKSLAVSMGDDQMKPAQGSGPSRATPDGPGFRGGPGFGGPGGGGGPGMRAGPSGSRPGMRRGPGVGPGGTQPTPADFVAHALTFDLNKDGSLNKDELLKFAEVMIAHRPPGPGGRGPGQGGQGPAGREPGGIRGGEFEGGRATRPQPK